MAENDQTKICPLCAETIKATAKVCPYCRKHQGSFFFISVFDGLALATLALFIGIIVLIFNIFPQGRSFSPGRDKIEVLNSRLAADVSSDSTNVFVSGLLTNQSDYAWQDLGFEVRYFDGAGKMFDVDSSGDDFTVLSHAEHSFRLDLSPRKSIPNYASYRVRVSSASDPGNWFSPGNW